jgi:hypothetical protein
MSQLMRDATPSMMVLPNMTHVHWTLVVGFPGADRIMRIIVHMVMIHD